MSQVAVETLVHALLLERSAALEGRELAAFIDGWSSLLDLIRRSPLLLPGASDEQHAVVAELVEQIRATTATVLADPDTQ